MWFRAVYGEQVLSLATPVGVRGNPGATGPAMWVRDQLDGLWCDEDFADWSPRGGRSRYLARPMATICVLQLLLHASDH